MRIVAFVLVAACGTSDAISIDAAPTWTLVAEDEPAALLAIWGADSSDVWVVGGRTTLAGSPAVLRYRDGWTRVDVGHTGLDLWWVFGLSADDVFFGGSGGTILRFHQGAFERMATPRTGTIFGIWGASPDDVWAVGDGGSGAGIVWHFDGTSWTEPPLPGGTPSRVFKVHGRAGDDVWMSCADGSVLHWQGTTLERQTTGVVAPLFSIVTTDDSVVAAGGLDTVGQIVEHATRWTLSALSVPARWRGMAARGTTVYAVGEHGLVAQREAGGWRTLDQHLTWESFHAAWVDPDGGLWAVGGDFDRTPLTSRGFLAYLGTDAISEVQP
jgi:hypothetical protein